MFGNFSVREGDCNFLGGGILIGCAIGVSASYMLSSLSEKIQHEPSTFRRLGTRILRFRSRLQLWFGLSLNMNPRRLHRRSLRTPFMNVEPALRAIH